jgi:hypothetical protein
MQKRNKNKRFLITTLIIVIIGIASHLLATETQVAELPIFNSLSLFTYFGVLIGFALTIYTFGLSMVVDIKKNISLMTELSEEKKTILYEKLVSGFTEIKQDIWLIFYAIILVIIFAIANEIVNPFGWEVEQYKIPETAFLSLFVLSTFAIFDIMKTLFNLSEINLELIQKGKASR